MIMSRALVLIALIATPLAAPAAPLAPTGKWHLFYQESSCIAERQFGDHALSFQPSPLGKTMRLVIVGPGRVARTRQLDSLIELSDGGQPIKSSSLVYGTSRKGMRGITTILAIAEAERVSRSPWLRIATLGTSPKSKRMAPSGSPVFSGEYAIGSTTALARELAKCLADLQRHWGIVEGNLPKPAKNAELSLQGIFKSDDYPEDAFNANQTGSTEFMLMIDERGRLIDCEIAKTSGVASIDGMGCQVILARAKAKPALDANGKPVKSIYTQTVQWQLAG
jgi:hypothetical protein